MGNLELPAQMSPCLRIFIWLLLDQSKSSVAGEIPLAISMIAKNDSPRDRGEASARQLMPMDGV
jgi:hypothetical protein